MEFLEHGRGTLISDLLRDTHDEAILTARRPDLASRLLRADAELAALNASDQPGTGARGCSSRRPVRRDREIRACGEPELAGFRQPLTLAGLARALPGPVVVINVSEYRSDALILAGRKLRVLPCPGLTPAALRGYLARFDRALASLAAAADDAAADAAWPELEEAFHATARWLWDVLAQSVLDHLGLTESLSATAGAGDLHQAPRIWWVPTGELARFPVHAAGYHGSPHSAARSVFSHAVSSYATSLTSLRQAITSQAPEQPPDGAVPGALAVVMPRTPPSARPATCPAPWPRWRWSCAVSRWPSPWPGQLRHGRRRSPPSRTRASPTSAATLRSCPQTRHADGCSSTTGPSPSRTAGTAGLAAGPGVPVRLRHGERRGDIPDEFVHLASAFQVIGFEHVVGTAWQVPDDITLAVTEGFYAAVWDTEAAGTRTRPPPCTQRRRGAGSRPAQPLPLGLCPLRRRQHRPVTCQGRPSVAADL